MMHHSNLIVVEYSVSQKAFHRQSIEEMLKQNRSHVMTKRKTDYIPIGIFDSEDQADEFIDLAGEIIITDYPLYRSIEGNLIAY